MSQISHREGHLHRLMRNELHLRLVRRALVVLYVAVIAFGDSVVLSVTIVAFGNSVVLSVAIVAFGDSIVLSVAVVAFGDRQSTSPPC